MSNALEPVAACDILKSHPKLEFRDGKYSYEITRQGDESIYKVSDGEKSVTAPIRWAFGLGQAGQTYLFQMDGSWYESRVSFFNEIQRLDITIGAQTQKPRTLEEAAGEVLNRKQESECFGCHSTGGVHQGNVDTAALTPGIECENCHGSGVRHVQALKTGDMANFAMPKLSAMTTEEMSDFCGRCHRTWAQIAANGLRGVVNVRFQPYRLTNSKCYDAADPRIRCVSCHEPHQGRVRETSYYDSKCMACHGAGRTGTATAARVAKMCPAAKKDCVTCHMPKVDLPGAHHRFSDHEIRIARKNDPYPD